MRRIGMVVLLGALAVPLSAGPLDWISSRLHRQVAPAFAEARLRWYLKSVLKNTTLKVSLGRAELTGAERKRLDPKILERIAAAGDALVVDVSGAGASGLAVFASRGLDRPDWNPASDYLAYLWVTSPAVFPGDADRAQALCVHLAGEPALFGNAPEAGPVWLKREPGGGGGGRGGGRGRGGRFFGKDRGDGYEARAGETSPDEDEIPAWVARGATRLALGDAKTPVKIGFLIALTRGAGGHGVQLTHVTGAGALGRPIFRDLHAPEVRPLRGDRDGR